MTSIIAQQTKHIRDDIAGIVEDEQKPESFGDLIKCSLERAGAHKTPNEIMMEANEMLVPVLGAFVTDDALHLLLLLDSERAILTTAPIPSAS